MATPQKSIIQSKTTQNAIGGCTTTVVILHLLNNVFGLDVPPEAAAAIVAIAGPMLARLFARIRG